MKTNSYDQTNSEKKMINKPNILRVIRMMMMVMILMMVIIIMMTKMMDDSNGIVNPLILSLEQDH